MPPKPRMVRKNAPTSTAMPGPSTLAAMSSTMPPPAPVPAAPTSPHVPLSQSQTMISSLSASNAAKNKPTTSASINKGSPIATSASKSSPLANSTSNGSPLPVTVNASKGSPMPANASKSMPPPPPPAPPKGILEAEVDAMSRSFRTAAVKTGQIYGFYVDTAKLGIQNYVPQPPASLSRGLARQVEEYDQLCDRVEAQLLRAIAVLQRDLKREQAAAEEARMVIASPAPISPTTPSDPVPPPISITAPNSEISPPLSAGGLNPTTPGRRPSTISLSSLNRPQFAHKLDLSGSTLRFQQEGLSAVDLDSAALAGIGRPPSPVTLAPKSARSHDLDADFMGLLETGAASSSAARPVDIDLTLDDDIPTGLGSAEQPIELDLDIDIFGDATHMPEVKKEPVDLDIEILDAIAPKDGAVGAGADLLAQLSQTGDMGGSGDFNLDMSALPSMDMNMATNMNMDLTGLDGGGNVELGGNTSMDVDMGMGMSNLDFAGMPLSDVDFSNVPDGEGMDMLDMDAFLGTSSTTGNETTGEAGTNA